MGNDNTEEKVIVLNSSNNLFSDFDVWKWIMYLMSIWCRGIQDCLIKYLFADSTLDEGCHSGSVANQYFGKIVVHRRI